METAKIGVTEHGDGCLDLSWAEKLDQVDGAVVSAKRMNLPLWRLLIQHQNKLLFHYVITGYGGTAIEPGVLEPEKALLHLKQFFQLKRTMPFPRTRIVVRVDPIIPTAKGIRTAKKVIEEAYELGVRRFRVSLLKMYKHVQERFSENGLPDPYKGSFQASAAQAAAVDTMLWGLRQKYPEIKIEGCAEPRLTAAEKVGCVGPAEYRLFGVELPGTAWERQRRDCLCLPGKIELLESEDACPNGCLYCRWQWEKKSTSKGGVE